MKTVIKKLHDGDVELTEDAIDFYGNQVRVKTCYFCQQISGYVKIADGDKYPQVCERLKSRGPTLIATRDTLLAVIRREYTRAKRSISGLRP